MTSGDQVNRLLALVPYLSSHPDSELGETAAVFGVSANQLLADLRVLWYCGLPGGLPGDLIEIDMDSVADSGRIRLSNADYLARPTRFSPDEALSLMVALRAVREIASGEVADGIESALAKLEGAAGALSPPTLSVAVAGGSVDVRSELAKAIEAGELVDLDYTDAGLTPSSPRVVPVKLIVRDGIGYLQAWSLERKGWRTYRIERITQVRATGQAAPAVGEPPEFGPGWLEQLPEAAQVTLKLRPEAAWIVEYYPTQDVRRFPHQLEVDLLVGDPAWLRALLLRLGSQVLSVSPPVAAAGAREAAADALLSYPAE